MSEYLGNASAAMVKVIRWVMVAVILLGATFIIAIMAECKKEPEEGVKVKWSEPMQSGWATLPQGDQNTKWFRP